MYIFVLLQLKNTNFFIMQINFGSYKITN